MVPTLLLALCIVARSDVPPPNTEGCEDKSAGDACKTDAEEDGGCVQRTCTRLDYSQGTPPSSVEYACLQCDPAAAPDDDTICGLTGGTVPLGLFGLALSLPLALRRRQG